MRPDPLSRLPEIGASRTVVLWHPEARRLPGCFASIDADELAVERQGVLEAMVCPKRLR